MSGPGRPYPGPPLRRGPPAPFRRDPSKGGTERTRGPSPGPILNQGEKKGRVGVEKGQSGGGGGGRSATTGEEGAQKRNPRRGETGFPGMAGKRTVHPPRERGKGGASPNRRVGRGRGRGIFSLVPRGRFGLGKGEGGKNGEVGKIPPLFKLVAAGSLGNPGPGAQKTGGGEEMGLGPPWPMAPPVPPQPGEPGGGGKKGEGRARPEKGKGEKLLFGFFYKTF